MRLNGPYQQILKAGILSLILLLSICPHSALRAQVAVEITVKLEPAAACDSLFIAGNFNGWNPADQRYRLHATNGMASIRLTNLPAGLLEWKFTRGSWYQVETGADGKDMQNRRLQLLRDTLADCVVQGWKNDARITPRHTATAQVQLMDSAFYFPALNRHKKIWIYLPPGYAKSKKRYPVLYMHDGQNLFDEALSAVSEWGVDESLDSLIARGLPAAIVVGIENGGSERMREYNAWPFTWAREEGPVAIAPAAEDYLQDLKDHLKPSVDKHYRTLPGRENTLTAGSSMGGLVACYAALKYPAVFGKAGVFSPSFWTAEGIVAFADSAAPLQQGKFFFYMGGREGERHLNNMSRVHQLLGRRSASMIYCVVDPEGEHNEFYWRKWFPEFFRWALADGFNIITSD